MSLLLRLSCQPLIKHPKLSLTLINRTFCVPRVKPQILIKPKQDGLLINHTNIKKFSTSTKRHAIPPLIWIVIKPLTKLSSILFGRSFRKWWAQLPSHKRQIFGNHMRRNRQRYAFLCGSIFLGSLIFYQSHIQENPITHRKRFILFTKGQVTEVSQLGYNEIISTNEKKLLKPNSHEVKRVLDVGNRLLNANQSLPGIKDIKWTIDVIDSDQVNAMAFPHGSIVVYTGLIKHCKTDDELAIIIGHEMSHVEAMSFSRLIDIISIGFIFLIWSFIPHDFGAVITQMATSGFLKIYYDLPYSRLLESEADHVGLLIASRACFDVRKSVTFWRDLDKKSGENKEDLEYLSTHPSHENRSADLLKLLPEALKLREECKCYKLTTFMEMTDVLSRKK